VQQAAMRWWPWQWSVGMSELTFGTHARPCVKMPLSAALKRMGKPRDCVTAAADIIVSRGRCVQRIAKGAGPRHVCAVGKLIWRPGAAARLVRPFVWSWSRLGTGSCDYVVTEPSGSSKNEVIHPEERLSSVGKLSGIYRKSRTKQKCKEIFSPFRPVSDRRKQAMYVFCNTKVRSRNHCCSGKTISITFCGCVAVALP